MAPGLSPQGREPLPSTSIDAPGSTPHEPGASSRSLPVLGPGLRPGIGISRSADRRIAFGGLLLAVIWLALAAASLLLPAAVRLGAWLPLHMVLAGAATTAIAAILPFFTAALVGARPAPAAVRIAGIGLVAGGAFAAMTVYGHAQGQALPGFLSGGSFLVGIGCVAFAAFRPLRRALGIRRRLVERAYAVAMVNVTMGATLATLLIAGSPDVGAAWGSLKPAHAWLNLVGFVGLVIVATLLHFAPTIVGSRIRDRRSGRVAVAGIGAGAPIVAAGFALQVDGLARLGGAVAVIGAIGVLAHAVAVHRDAERGRWTTDAGWHLLTSGSLLAGQAWLAAGFAIAGGRVVVFGADPAGWSLGALVGPLVLGGVVQVVLGAMTHLLPAVGPGDPVRHAAQRRLLGRTATLRLMGLNFGAALVTLGLGPAVGAAADPAVGLVELGVAAAAGSVMLSLALLALAAGSRRGATTRGSTPLHAAERGGP